MNAAFLASPSVNDTCTVKHITIVARPQCGEVVTYINHSEETTLDEHRSEVKVSTRRFPARVACPVSAARLLATGARALHPHAIVELVNA